MTTERHIQHSSLDYQGKAWCGVKVTSQDRAFMDLDLAAYHLLRGGSVPVCPACLEAARKALTSAVEAGEKA